MSHGGGGDRWLVSYADFITLMFAFFLMLYVVHCWNDPALFHTGWFVESLFTQVLVVLVIRTRLSPFWRSRPSRDCATRAGR